MNLLVKNTLRKRRKSKFGHTIEYLFEREYRKPEKNDTYFAQSDISLKMIHFIPCIQSNCVVFLAMNIIDSFL
jgi:hypothetical protein